MPRTQDPSLNAAAPVPLSARQVGGGRLFHRDVKTANVLLDGRRAAFLGDFGLARAVVAAANATTGRTHVSTANLIGTHQVCGPALPSPHNNMLLSVLTRRC